VTRRPSAPRKLEKSDTTEGFRSGADELDEWLKKYAWENLRANNAVTYVSVAGTQVLGYYAIAVGGVVRTALPRSLTKGTQPDPTPVIVLGRLAIDGTQQGNGLGAGLLRDALIRSAMISESVGAAALLVHARDESAKRFYLRNGNFLQSPIDDLQLMVPMKELRRLFPPQEGA